MRRILVVEDEIVIGIYLREELQDAGFVPVLRNDAESALHVFESGNVDGAIIDVSLPGMSGIDLVERIRAKQPAFPILLATAADFSAFQTRFTSDRHICLLAKPYQTPDLFICLKQLGLSSS